MTISVIKQEKIASTALDLLQRELLLPGLIWTDVTKAEDWVGNKNDTVTVRIPARTEARERALRGSRGAANAASEGTGIIIMDDLAEDSLDLKLDKVLYKAVPTTDEEETLDIVSYGRQILDPMTRSVAEKADNAVAELMVNAPYVNTATIDPANAQSGVLAGLYRARRYLNSAFVPQTDRVVVVGAAIEEALLNSGKLHEVDKSGSDSALRDATIGRIAGFNRIVVSNSVPDDFGVAFHMTAFAGIMLAPKIPDGVSAGKRVSSNGIGMRWIKDYDFRQAQDRSMVDLYYGLNYIADGPANNEVQTVTITGTPTGGSFTLTFDGETTGAIAWNATAAAVKSALTALSNVDAKDLTVTGGPGPGTAWVVTFGGTDAGKNVPQATATSSLTGGSSPAVAVTTNTAGGSGSKTFVRAVKLALA